jgi:hypothetical protein
LEIVHTNLYGPTRIKGLNGEYNFMLLIDDYTRMNAIFFHKKSNAFDHFNIYKEMVETETYFKIKFMISYHGGEFKSKEFMELYGEHGIKR